MSTEKPTSGGYSRRQALALGLGGLVPLTCGGLTMMADPRRAFAATAEAAGPRWDRTLVIIHLSGGNDGLNTLVPYRNELYYKARPTIAIPADRVLPLTETQGLHPAMETLMPSWQAKDMAIVQNIGYPHTNRSHLRSMEIWDTASEHDVKMREGWIGQLFRATGDRSLLKLDGLNMGLSNGGALAGEHMRHARLENSGLPENFDYKIDPERIHSGNSALQHIAHVYENTDQMTGLFADINNVDIPNQDEFFKAGVSLSNYLLNAARVIKAGIRVPVIFTVHNGFDSHKDQLEEHETGVGRLAASLAAFRTAMIAMGKWNDVLVMTVSEFGRRVEENDNRGTDHGSAAPHFLMGGRVKGGLYGPEPDLTNLDERGDLKLTTHFREWFALSCAWWDMPDHIRADVFGKYKAGNYLKL